MKIKDPFHKSIEEAPPPGQRERVLKQAAGILARGAEPRKPTLLELLFRPAFGLGVAGACAAAVAVLYFGRGTTNEAPGTAFLQDAEMVRNADMLDDLEVLLKLRGLENLDKKKWPKKKS